MLNFIIKKIKKIFIFIFPILYKKIKDRKVARKWENEGKLVPPPHIVKQRIIQNYQKGFKYNTFIETGTYLGDMLLAQLNFFNILYSVELSQQLYDNAKIRFSKNDKIKLLQGDSGKVLYNLVPEIKEPAIFWLDGHYSLGITARGEKDCPILEELNAILHSSKFNHVLLIDDARCFNGNGDYPSLIELEKAVKKYNDLYKMEVKDDIIRFVI
jgi:hypothetical protein